MIKINQNSIESKMLAWSNSAQGKETIQQVVKSNVPADTSLYKDIQQYLEHYVELFKTILNESITEANQMIKSGSNPIQSPAFSSPKFQNSGVYEVEIQFTPIKRKSMYPEEYSEGAYNLTKLLDLGYTARDYVYENDGEVRKRSLKSRGGMHFTRRACIKFNSMTPSNISAVPHWY